MRRDKCIKYAECLPQETLFLIIMPCKNCATKLIIKYYYKKGNHAHFLIISDHEEIQEWESECKKESAKEEKDAKQIMAPLPQIRL